MKIGYYRHYFDNLPACDIAPATDATWSQAMFVEPLPQGCPP